MKKTYYRYAFLIAALFFATSCDRGVGETIETAYVEPLPEVLKYSFSRNGSSNVDTFETSLIVVPQDYLYNSYLRRARLSTDYDYYTFLGHYKEYSNGAKLLEEIATSPLKANERETIKQDIWNMVETTARISGRNSADYTKTRGRSAEKGLTGYIGNDIGDLNLAFADEKGLVVAEAYKNMLLGAIQLDKVLNFHLDDSLLNSQELRTKHENVELLAGKNYTQLEHHWDLAYGYYAKLSPLVRAEGLPVLKDSETKIFNAFVMGRYEMGKFRYDEMQNHLKIIREELSKAIAIRAINALIGVNTEANLKENPIYAFSSISEAYGLIYALQFTRNAEGKPYFTYAEIQNILQKMTNGDGLWDTQRLLAGAEVEGSLKNIATQVGKPFGLTIDSIKR